jgi:hypothetical protein
MPVPDPTSPAPAVVSVFVKIAIDPTSKKPQITLHAEASGTTLPPQRVKSRGEVHFFFIKGDRPGPAIETADLYIIPQTVKRSDGTILTRRESPFQKPEDPVHFIEDPGWGAGDPGNVNGGIAPVNEAVFAGSIPIRGVPQLSNDYKYAVIARGDVGRWIALEDPTIKIEP